MEGKASPGLVGSVTDEPSGIGRFVPIVSGAFAVPLVKIGLQEGGP